MTFNRPVLHAFSFLSGGRVSVKRKTMEKTLAVGLGKEMEIPTFSASISFVLTSDFHFLYFVR